MLPKIMGPVSFIHMCGFYLYGSWVDKHCIPAAVGGTSLVTFLSLALYCEIASCLGCLSSMVFIGRGDNDESSLVASVNSFCLLLKITDIVPQHNLTN